MPKVRPIGSGGIKPDGLTRLLLSYGLDAAKMARLLGCCSKTGRARLEIPETLTVGELRRLNRWGVDAGELNAALWKGGPGK